MAVIPYPEKRWKRAAIWAKRIVLVNPLTLLAGPYIEDDGSGNLKLFDKNGVGVSLSAPELALLDGITGAPVQSARVSFTETTGAGVYTGSVTIPAGALLVDVKVWSTALWTATTSALMDVGDAADADGWFTQINLKATDLLVGEEINFENLGGKQGVYLVAATGLRSAAYSAAARLVTGVVTTVGAAGNAGRTHMSVIYSIPTASAAVKV